MWHICFRIWPTLTEISQNKEFPHFQLFQIFAQVYLFDYHSTVKCEIFGVQFLTEVAQPRLLWAKRYIFTHFLLPEVFRFCWRWAAFENSPLCGSERRSLRGSREPLRGRRVCWAQRRRQSRGRFRPDQTGTWVVQWAGERLCNLNGNWADWHLDCNKDESKLGCDQGARHEGGEVGRKPLTL